ncbi:MAG: BTAD domain-containing putative transcriptional regulator [Slackia sp.]|nr:BTAD domain-containing putative transcriptional regulator [Slackia sp.]
MCDALGDDGLQGFADGDRRARLADLKTKLARHRARRMGSSSAPGVVPASPRISDEVPLMTVRLFGGVEISIGGVPVDISTFRKPKIKTLLAVLVLHRGKEVARREILDILWPGSSGQRAVNNFYSLWSALRRALGDGYGNCPYLVRHQTSCMVDARYVRSDIDEFEELCRTLFFGRPEVGAWMDAFARLQDDFSCDLLPSEMDSPYIDHLRRSYRGKLVDAYTAAADRLCDIGESQAALWFAHAAFEKSQKREDVYCVLMRAQMLAGQRSLAMETFMECKAFMAEELGMDLSERMMRLHRDLISNASDGSLVSERMERCMTADVLK